MLNCWAIILTTEYFVRNINFSKEKSFDGGMSFRMTHLNGFTFLGVPEYVYERILYEILNKYEYIASLQIIVSWKLLHLCQITRSIHCFWGGYVLQFFLLWMESWKNHVKIFLSNFFHYFWNDYKFFIIKLSRAWCSIKNIRSMLVINFTTIYCIPKFHLLGLNRTYDFMEKRTRISKAVLGG